MKKLNENLSEIFDVTPIPTEEHSNVAVPVVPVVETPSEIESDFNFARSNIRNLIRQGNGAIDNILQVAAASEHPRAYEVASNLIKTMADMNKDLLDIQKKKQELTGKAPEAQTTTVNVDKAVFVGSTNDLLKKIKEERSGNPD